MWAFQPQQNTSLPLLGACAIAKFRSGFISLFPAGYRRATSVAHAVSVLVTFFHPFPFRPFPFGFADSPSNESSPAAPAVTPNDSNTLGIAPRYSDLPVSRSIFGRTYLLQ